MNIGLFVFQAFCVLLFGVTYLVMTIYFTGASKWIAKAGLLFLSMIPVILLDLTIVQWVNFFGFILPPLELQSQVGILSSLLVGLSIFLGISSIIPLVFVFSKTNAFFRTSILLLVMGILIVSTALGIELSGVDPLAPFFLLHFSIAIHGCLVIYVVFARKPVKTVPSNRQALNEDMLSEKQADLVRINAFMMALINLSLNLNTVVDPVIIMENLGNELKQFGLHCFITYFQPGSDEMVAGYLSESPEAIRFVEMILGSIIPGYRLKRQYFGSLYDLLESKQVCYLGKDNLNATEFFLGNTPAWIKNPIRHATVFLGNEASLLIPLITDDKAIGLMGVWGPNLTEVDIAPFRVFGSQVAWAIERAQLHQSDLLRVEDLARSNTLISALSNVAARLVTTQNFDVILDTLGNELQKLGLNCAVVTLNENKDLATIKYVSFEHEIIQRVQNHFRIQLINYQIPRKLWPSTVSVQERRPVWYSSPYNIFRNMFPIVPQSIGRGVLNSIGLWEDSQICFLPLESQDNVIGIMTIWGRNLTPSDTATLSVFSHQVAGILFNVSSYEEELRRTSELTRSNKFILGLSYIASRLDNISNFSELAETLGIELKKLGINCMIGLIDNAQQNMKVEYLSIEQDLKKHTSILGSFWPREIIIPRHLWPTDQALVTKQPYWDPNPFGNVSKMFPYVPRQVFEKALQAVMIDLNEPICYFPMIISDVVVGILAVWGKDLRREDIPAISAFSDQVAISLKNTNLYNQAQEEIRERIQVEKQIRSMLDEKDILLKEIHHRVKNNLQVISSLLSLQSAQDEDPVVKDALQESQNRVRSMALIHEKLYQSSDLARIDFNAYLHSLVTSLVQSYQVRSHRLEILVKAENVYLNVDTAIPCGLIVNELVSNSLKYAFPEGRTGKIAVSCQKTSEGHYMLIVEDDGRGLPAEFDLAKASSLGLKLVTSLARQIDGNVGINSSNGTQFIINFEYSENGS